MTPPAAAAARSSAYAHPGVRRAPVRRAPVRRAPVRRSPARARRGREAPGLALRTVDALNAASQSSLLDRLIRSRVWIGVLAFSLIGIVAMQVFVMKLNTEVGRALARQAALQRQITLAQIEGSQESAGDLVEPTAAAAGMTVAAPGSVHFVSSTPSDVSAAARALSAPLPSQAATTVGASPIEGQTQTGAPASEAPATSEGPRG